METYACCFIVTIRYRIVTGNGMLFSFRGRFAQSSLYFVKMY